MNDTVQIVLATLAGGTIAGVATLLGAALGTRMGHTRKLRTDLYLNLLPGLDQSYRDSGFREVDDNLAMDAARVAIVAGGKLRHLGQDLGHLVWAYRHPNDPTVIERYLPFGREPSKYTVATDVDVKRAQMMTHLGYRLQPWPKRILYRSHQWFRWNSEEYRRIFKTPLRP